MLWFVFLAKAIHRFFTPVGLHPIVLEGIICDSHTMRTLLIAAIIGAALFPTGCVPFVVDRPHQSSNHGRYDPVRVDVTPVVEFRH